MTIGYCYFSMAKSNVALGHASIIINIKFGLRLVNHHDDCLKILMNIS